MATDFVVVTYILVDGFCSAIPFLLSVCSFNSIRSNDVDVAFLKFDMGSSTDNDAQVSKAGTIHCLDTLVS